MRVVVVGATGNVGTSVVQALEGDPAVTSIVGVARRLPRWRPEKTEWRAADVRTADLTEIFAGADVVVHLAWLFQPARDGQITWRNNVLGSIRVFDAVAAANVPALVYASSIGAYSPKPADDHAVDEGYPTHGWPRVAYAREKAYVERVLDTFERRNLGVRVVRMRPGFIFKREASTEQRRLFAGPFLPRWLIRPGLIPVVPDIPGLRLQVLHAADAAEAYRLAVTQPVSGAFNLRADQVLDPAALAELLDARLVPVSPSLVRTAVAAAWRLRLAPATPGMVEMALMLPIMDVSRAHEVLGWTPRHSAGQAVRELIRGMHDGAGMDTGPLAPEAGLAGRLRELATGVGKRS
ncbi:NAD-dependent epimerase/dehydratase family protein [Streptosporangiaceae bacterium NEAU-GS5]|nr:NAD-dependent epimerase/dehydratase family protein [Streptosporangiaceae bacterium NEAU-GS5]